MRPNSIFLETYNIVITPSEREHSHLSIAIRRKMRNAIAKETGNLFYVESFMNIE